MKFLVAFAFLIAAVAAQTAAPHQNDGRLLLELLEKRAEATIASAKKTLDTHKEKSHLLTALEHQVKKVEELAAEIKKQLAASGHVHLHHIHVVEEELFYLEHRIAEEIYAIEHATGPNPPHGQTVEQIVARAEKIIAQAKEAIQKHPHAREVSDVERELIVLNALISVIKSKPSPADLKKEEEELARQEKSLQQLIEKINARTH